MFSDNATNFKAANAEIAKNIEKRTNKFCSIKGIKWTFFPPTASHFNGACERMIRTTRKVLAGILLKETRLTNDVLNTILVEVESIINNRPLTKVSDDVGDDTPLTTAHLLIQKSIVGVSLRQFTIADTYRRRYRYAQHIIDLFWTRYMREYLGQLQKRNKWHTKEDNLKISLDVK